TASPTRSATCCSRSGAPSSSACSTEPAHRIRGPAMALHLPTGPFLTELIIGYMTLFSIINPFGVAFVFLSMTRRASEAERTAIARRIGVYSFVILLVSLFVGSQILNIFGISVPALRIAGGLVVALS